MGFFGRGEKKEAARAAAVAEQERLAALELPDLAEEVFRRGFGTGGPGEQLEIKVNALFDLFAPLEGGFGGDVKPRLAIENLITEAVGELERAGLVATSGGGAVTLLYRKTRAGEEALAGGSVADQLRT